MAWQRLPERRSASSASADSTASADKRDPPPLLKQARQVYAPLVGEGPRSSSPLATRVHQWKFQIAVPVAPAVEHGPGYRDSVRRCARQTGQPHRYGPCALPRAAESYLWKCAANPVPATPPIGESAENPPTPD